MAKFFPQNPIWNHDPEAALVEVEKRIEETGKTYLASGHFKALDRLPRNIRDTTDESIALYATNVSDISPLAGMRLTDIKLNKTVTDISALAQVEGLKNLEIWNAQITEIETLLACEEMSRLDLRTNTVFDLSPLGRLLNLTSLSLDLHDLSNIPEMPHLTHLAIASRPEHEVKLDLAFLAASPDLGFLSVSSEKICSSNVPQNCPRLRYINLKLDNFADLQTVASYPALTELNVRGSTIDSIEDILWTAPLVRIDLSETQIADVGSLVALPSLRDIAFKNTLVEEIAHLSYKKEIWSLDASGTQVTSLANWNPRATIRFLRVDDTSVSNLRPLFGTRLIDLSARNTPLSDITGFAGIKGLSRLDISGTQVAEISETDSKAAVLNIRPEDTYDPRDRMYFSFRNTPLANTGFNPKVWQATLEGNTRKGVSARHNGFWDWLLRK